MSPVLAEAPVVKRNDVTVRLDAEVVAKAKTVASSRGLNLAEYLLRARADRGRSSPG